MVASGFVGDPGRCLHPDGEGEYLKQCVLAKDHRGPHRFREVLVRVDTLRTDLFCPDCGARTAIEGHSKGCGIGPV